MIFNFLECEQKLFIKTKSNITNKILYIILENNTNVCSRTTCSMQQAVARMLPASIFESLYLAVL